MPKTVICFWGAGNIGKTESVRALWEKLDTSHKPPLHEINRDICATVDFEGIRVGISSLGDPDSGQEMWLDELVGKECDIIVCASRTKGRTVRAVEERAAAKKEITKRKADFQRRENKFVKSMMTKFDKDDDGKLSEAEFREFVVYQRKASAEARSRGVPPHLGREPATRIPVEFFKSLGLDAKTMTFEQRHLVFGELKQIYAKGLKSHDANSDGKLDKKEVKRGMVVAKPGSITPHTKFTAEVYILKKEEGGRHTPFHNKYRPQFYLRTMDVTGEITLPEGVDMVMPGDHVTITVTLIYPVALNEGLRFAIREGGRTVGAGQVLKILE